MKSSAHTAVMSVLRKMKKTAVWQRMSRKKGVLSEISLTKGGNLRLVLQADARQLLNKRSDREATTCHVLKRNKNLFATASLLKKGLAVNVALRRALGKWYCTSISRSMQRKLVEF